MKKRGKAAGAIIYRIEREVRFSPDVQELEQLYGKTQRGNWDAFDENPRIRRAINEMNEKRKLFQDLVKAHPDVFDAKQKVDAT